MYPWLSGLYTELVGRYDASKLHHGLLFMGPRDVGKGQLSEQLAKALLCKSETKGCDTCKSCLLIKAGSHPDLHTITTDKSQIGVDAVRLAISKVNQTSQLSGNKVIIIQTVELMSESASNALLKTLEEPTPNTYLLMTTNEPQRLLPTILSRCEKLLVALPNFEQSCSWLESIGVTAPTKTALLAHGSSPITFKNELEDSETKGFDDFTETLRKLKSGSETANRAALQWQSEASKVTNWLGQYWIEEYKKNKNTKAYGNYQTCLSSAKRLNHPGLNKSLILNTLFGEITCL
ncbi:MAG: DNA polymerase-3 subunit delta' [Glaciecola sp.]|jgi:DNA polymerase-3 subunit delta'